LPFTLQALTTNATHTAFEKAMRQPSKLRCAELFTQELFPHGSAL